MNIETQFLFSQAMLFHESHNPKSNPKNTIFIVLTFDRKTFFKTSYTRGLVNLNLLRFS